MLVSIGLPAICWGVAVDDLVQNGNTTWIWVASATWVPSVIPLLAHFLIAAEGQEEPCILLRANYFLWWLAYYGSDSTISIIQHRSDEVIRWVFLVVFSFPTYYGKVE